MNRFLLYRKIACYALFIVSCFLTGKVLRFILADDVNSYTRVTFHEMYEQDNIDVLFVGSSHCYRSFVPEILDEELGVNTFNAGTSAQTLDGSYMIIKEAIRQNDISHIYLEVFFNRSTDIKKERTLATYTYIISDYLRPSIDKIIYLLQATNSDHYANSFIVSRRYWYKLFDYDYIKYNLMNKSTYAYQNYQYDFISDENQSYIGKGYVANRLIISDWDYFSSDGWDPIDLENVSDDWRTDLNDIITLCEDKGIPLTLISAPMPNYYLTSIGNYDDYINYLKEIIKGRNIDYYDFNLCKEKYFPDKSELFMDTNHLNCYGAELFSRSFGMLISGKISEEDMFYHSYKEKLENLYTKVYGICYQDVELKDGKMLRKCRIVVNDNIGLEYLIAVYSSNDDNTANASIIRNYSDNIYFTIDPSTKGNCVIKYRHIGSNVESGCLAVTI